MLTFQLEKKMMVNVDTCEMLLIAGKQLERQSSNTLFLLTSHSNGSLNLWHLSMEEKSNFATILNIAQKSRLCGHRFKLEQVRAHLVPLGDDESMINLIACR